MALKLNIQPDIEHDMDALLPQTKLRSKTHYINQAIAVYNQKLKREFQLARLKRYFKDYTQEAEEIMHDFGALSPLPA